MTSREPDISIVIAVVGGVAPLRRCLLALSPQLDGSRTEVIVPYDRYSIEVEVLAGEFPAARFHYIEDLGSAADPRQTAHLHRLYDRRRAVGLAATRGAVVAMTEDYAVPAPDWCAQLRMVHQQPYAVIGGAIDNAVDRPLHWALYYCDFGRYGRPLSAGPAGYVSDVNVSYKRAALESVRAAWTDAYHETTVHWLLRARGEVLYLDPRLLVVQHRPPVSLMAAFQERLDWGRVFAETRAAVLHPRRRWLYAAGTPALPLLFFARALRHMLRQRRTAVQIATVVPLVAWLASGWAIGELAGYVQTDHAGERRVAG